MRPRISKLPYYARSASVLLLQLRRGSRLRALALRGPISFRNGLSFEVSSFLDLLILKETIYDDVYRLSDLEGEGPKLIIDVGAGIGSFSILVSQPRSSRGRPCWRSSPTRRRLRCSRQT